LQSKPAERGFFMSERFFLSVKELRLSLQQKTCRSSENENIQETVMVTGNPVCAGYRLFIIVSGKDQVSRQYQDVGPETAY